MPQNFVLCLNPAHGVKHHIAGSQEAVECHQAARAAASPRSAAIGAVGVPRWEPARKPHPPKGRQRHVFGADQEVTVTKALSDAGVSSVTQLALRGPAHPGVSFRITDKDGRTGVMHLRPSSGDSFIGEEADGWGDSAFTNAFGTDGGKRLAPLLDGGRREFQPRISRTRDEGSAALDGSALGVMTSKAVQEQYGIDDVPVHVEVPDSGGVPFHVTDVTRDEDGIRFFLETGRPVRALTTEQVERALSDGPQGHTPLGSNESVQVVLPDHELIGNVNRAEVDPERGLVLHSDALDDPDEDDYEDEPLPPAGMNAMAVFDRLDPQTVSDYGVEDDPVMIDLPGGGSNHAVTAVEGDTLRGITLTADGRPGAVPLTHQEMAARFDDLPFDAQTEVRVQDASTRTNYVVNGVQTSALNGTRFDLIKE